MRDYEELVATLRECKDPRMTEAADVIEELSKPKWISVEDALPKKGTVVLAFGTRSATTGMFQGVGTAPWFWWWKGHTIKRVTHWMPLPSMEGLNET